VHAKIATAKSLTSLKLINQKAATVPKAQEILLRLMKSIHSKTEHKLSISPLTACCANPLSSPAYMFHPSHAQSESPQPSPLLKELPGRPPILNANGATGRTSYGPCSTSEASWGRLTVRSRILDSRPPRTKRSKTWKLVWILDSGSCCMAVLRY
jgi:hypothetical protein